MNLQKNTTENNNLFRIITGRKEGRKEFFAAVYLP